MFLAFFLIVFWIIYWTFVFGMKNRMKQLILLVIGLVVPGGAEILAAYVACYIVYVTFFKRKTEDKNVDHSTQGS